MHIFGRPRGGMRWHEVACMPPENENRPWSGPLHPSIHPCALAQSGDEEHLLSSPVKGRKKGARGHKQEEGGRKGPGACHESEIGYQTTPTHPIKSRES